MSSTMTIENGRQTIVYRKAVKNDFDDIKELYVAASAQENGLAREPKEITDRYINKIIHEPINRGLIMVAETGEKVIGTINATIPEPACFSHLLNEITFAVHPDYQKKGIGKRLFGKFMEEVIRHMPEITRVEILARESNPRAIKMYESFGFKREGLLRNGIKNSNGIPEGDVVLGWLR